MKWRNMKGEMCVCVYVCNVLITEQWSKLSYFFNVYLLQSNLISEREALCCYMSGIFWRKCVLLFTCLSYFKISYQWFKQNDAFMFKTAGQRAKLLTGQWWCLGRPYRQWCGVCIGLAFPLFLFALGSPEMWLLWLQLRTGEGVEFFHHVACGTSYREGSSWE